MLGYKFINIKIQIAYIKQIIYCYLFNLFIISPNIFLKIFFNDFSKDSLGLSSKEQYQIFTNNNKEIEKDFYKKLDEVDKKIKKYMFLATILNKNMNTNFNNISEEEINRTGSEELQYLFYEVFFDFLIKIKESYNLNIDSFYNDSGTQKNSNDSLASTNSPEGTFKGAGFIPTTFSMDKNVLIPYFNFNNGFIPINKESDVPLSDAFLKEKIIDNYSNTISGEFYYKIKDEINISLSCGNKSRKNIIIFSFRDNKLGTATGSKESLEFLAVQQFYDWTKDDSYKNLDQFIFYRKPEIKDILKYSKNNNGTIIEPEIFNSNTFTGAKLLNRKEILELKENLKNTNDNNGFIAIIPKEKIDQEKFDKINKILTETGSNSGFLFVLSLFSDEERKMKMSLNDVSKTIGSNGNKNILNKTIFYENNGFNPNELFDLYFLVSSNMYDLKTIETNQNVQAWDYDPNIIDKELIKENLTSFNLENLLNKNGKFVLYSKDVYLSYSFGYFQFKKNLTKYLTMERKKILELKLNNLEEEIFGINKNVLDSASKLETNPSYDLQKNVSKFIKENFYDRLMTLLENKEYSSFINSFYDSGVLKSSVSIDKLNFGQITFDFETIKNQGLRSYKNFKDFIIYYKDTVESLAREATDRV